MNSIIDEKKVVLPKAGFWIRFVAWLLDHFLIAIPTSFILSILFYKASLGEIADFSSLLTGILFIPYAIFFWGRYGATPGKMIFGLKIVKVDGQNIGYSRAALRYLGYIICNLTLGIGYLLIIFSKDKQSLHDKIAQTYVVHTKAGPKLRPWISETVRVVATLTAAFVIGTTSGSIIFNLLLGFSVAVASLASNLIGSLLAGLFAGWYLGQKGWLYGGIAGIVLIAGHRVIVAIIIVITGPPPAQVGTLSGLLSILNLILAVLGGAFGGFLGEKFAKHR